MKHILKKDLPFAKKGTEIFKYESDPILQEWIIKRAGTGYWLIGYQNWDMSEWIEEVEEVEEKEVNIFPKKLGKPLEKEFSITYSEYKKRGYLGRFFGHDIMYLPNDDLYFIIAYLDNYIKGLQKEGLTK